MGMPKHKKSQTCNPHPPPSCSAHPGGTAASCQKLVSPFHNDSNTIQAHARAHAQPPFYSTSLAVMEQAAGRVTVIACGTFAGPVEEQAQFTKVVVGHVGCCSSYHSTLSECRMATTHVSTHPSPNSRLPLLDQEMAGIVDAVVVLVNQMAPEDADDTVWKANAERFLELTGSIPLGLYECPKPYHRLLSAETLGWCAATGRFLFHKDTCCRTQAIKDKLAAVAPHPRFGFYNANAATLRMSLENGARWGSGQHGLGLLGNREGVAWSLVLLVLDTVVSGHQRVAKGAADQWAHVFGP